MASKKSRYFNVPNEPGIKYNPVTKTYLVYRIIKGEEQYHGKIKSLEEARKIRNDFAKILPAETTAQTNRRTKTFSGKIDPKEIRKATTFFYKRGEIASPNYIDLPNPQKDRVRTNVQTGHTPGKFSKITQFTPLSKSAQNKILKYFPDADFDSWKKGFHQTADPVRFDAVEGFINRGYKPAFTYVKQLPKKTQDFIVEAFGKEAAAAGTPIRFGLGRKFGIPPKENQVLNSRITNFITNMGKAYPYAFSFDKPENWIIQQMARAADKKNPAYKVLKNDAGKIIGASENGVKYYHANSLIGNSIANHPEAKQISKFVTVAREAKASIPQSLLKIFPKGFDRNLLLTNRAYTDLLRWLDNSQGRRLVANAIQVHHAGEGSVGGSPALARDLQLLTAADNMAASSIKTAIENKDFSRVPELKEKGIRLNVGGVEYGAGPETETAGLKRIEKASLSKLQAQLKIDSELGGFAKFLGQEIVGLAKTNVGGICPIPLLSKKAGGGRIGFAAGSNCARQMEMAFAQNPVKVIQEVSELPGNKSINKIKNAAKGFLGFLGKVGPKVGKYGAIAAAGAVAQPLIKQFMNDDPSTYLTDPDQQAGMLEALIEGERPKPRSEILDWGTTAGTVGATAAAVPGTSALWKARRLPTLERAGMGMPRAALGPAMKLLSGMFTPAGLLATEPLRIAQKRREGESWGEIGTDPMTWMGPAFAPSMTRMATRGMNPASLLPKLLRLGMSRAALAAMGPVGWVGLAASLGWEGYSQYKDYKKGRGFFASDED